MFATPRFVRHLWETDAQRKARILDELNGLLADEALARAQPHILEAYRAVFYDRAGGRLPRNFARHIRSRADRICRDAQRLRDHSTPSKAATPATGYRLTEVGDQVAPSADSP